MDKHAKHRTIDPHFGISIPDCGDHTFGIAVPDCHDPGFYAIWPDQYRDADADPHAIAYGHPARPDRDSADS